MVERHSQRPKHGADEQLPALERLRIAPMPEASRLSGLSEDSLRRHHSNKLIRLSPRRLGMRVGDALMVSANK